MATLPRLSDPRLLRKIITPCQIAARYKTKRRGEKKPIDLSWTVPIIERQKQIKEGKLSLTPEPAKLHMIWRVKPLKGRPCWEKDIAAEFGIGIDDKILKAQVVKNTPAINEKLKEIKHLIKIVPVTFPYGLPENESDYEHCYLRDNGEFVVQRKVEPVTEEIKIDPNPQESKWKMDKETVDKHCRDKLQAYDLNSEYHETKYVYKYNQDGKEYRYFGDKAMLGKRDWF